MIDEKNEWNYVRSGTDMTAVRAEVETTCILKGEDAWSRSMEKKRG